MSRVTAVPSVDSRINIAVPVSRQQYCSQGYGTAAQDVSGSELVVVLRIRISFAKAYQKVGEHGITSGNSVKVNIILAYLES